jgi:hypothetical protein
VDAEDETSPVAVEERPSVTNHSAVTEEWARRIEGELADLQEVVARLGEHLRLVDESVESFEEQQLRLRTLALPAFATLIEVLSSPHSSRTT